MILSPFTFAKYLSPNISFEGYVFEGGNIESFTLYNSIFTYAASVMWGAVSNVATVLRPFL